MGFLAGKRALIVGVASDRSIAWGIAKAMHREGAEIAYTYQNDKLKERVQKLANQTNSDILIPCDVSSDEQIEALERKLRKVQPLIQELNELKATRRVLLSEKNTTGGGGSAGRAQITQEEVITFLRKNGPSTPAQISDGLSVPGGTVRSHLQRHKETTYTRDEDDGTWTLVDS